FGPPPKFHGTRDILGTYTVAVAVSAPDPDSARIPRPVGDPRSRPTRRRPLCPDRPTYDPMNGSPRCPRCAPAAAPPARRPPSAARCVSRYGGGFDERPDELVSTVDGRCRHPPR